MLRICPPQPRRTFRRRTADRSGSWSGHGGRGILSIRSTGVCRMSRNEKAPALLTRTSTSRPRPVPARKVVCGFGSCQVDRDDLYRQSVLFIGSSSAAASSFAGSSPARISRYPSSASRLAIQRPMPLPAPVTRAVRSLFDRSLACHYGSFASSSRIFGAGRRNVCSISYRPNTCGRCSSCGGRTRCGSPHRLRAACSQPGRSRAPEPSAPVRTRWCPEPPDPFAAHQTSHVN